MWKLLTVHKKRNSKSKSDALEDIQNRNLGPNQVHRQRYSESKSGAEVDTSEAPFQIESGEESAASETPFRIETRWDMYGTALAYTFARWDLYDPGLASLSQRQMWHINGLDRVLQY